MDLRPLRRDTGRGERGTGNREPAIRGPQLPVARTPYPVPHVLWLFLVACGASAPLTTNVGALGFDRVLSRGALSYAVAFSGDEIVSVELRTEFELIVRERTGGERLRLTLGPHQ